MSNGSRARDHHGFQQGGSAATPPSGEMGRLSGCVSIASSTRCHSNELSWLCGKTHCGQAVLPVRCAQQSTIAQVHHATACTSEMGKWEGGGGGTTAVLMTQSTTVQGDPVWSVSSLASPMLVCGQHSWTLVSAAHPRPTSRPAPELRFTGMQNPSYAASSTAAQVSQTAPPPHSPFPSACKQYKRACTHEAVPAQGAHNDVRGSEEPRHPQSWPRRKTSDPALLPLRPASAAHTRRGYPKVVPRTEVVPRTSPYHWWCRHINHLCEYQPTVLTIHGTRIQEHHARLGSKHSEGAARAVHVAVLPPAGRRNLWAGTHVHKHLPPAARIRRLDSEPAGMRQATGMRGNRAAPPTNSRAPRGGGWLAHGGLPGSRGIGEFGRQRLGRLPCRGDGGVR